MTHSSTHQDITIQAVEDKSTLEQFIDLPYQLHQVNPHFVPPLRISEWEKFDPKKNPFYEHARVKLFVARRGEHVVGRVAAIDDDHHNATHADNLLFFGFFEAADQDVATALMNTIETHASELGRSAVRGPANPSMNDGSGFQIDAFDTDPFIMMPFNPASYPSYVESLGYSKIKDLYAWYFDIQKPDVGGRISRIAARASKRYDVTVRDVNMRNFEAELGLLKHIYSEAWEKNWGFVKYTDQEFDHLAAELKLILDPKMALFIESAGKVAGVCVCLPNVNEVFKRIPNGRLLPRGIPYLLGMKLRRKWFIQSVRLPILGILPEFRNKGFEAILIDHIVTCGYNQGYSFGELSWILEDNHSINQAIKATGATIYKTYRLYEKTLS
jgi:GNAT superfamily N-acetyltransferase